MKQVHPLIQHNSVQKSHSTIHSLPSNLTFWFMLHLLTITCSNAPTHCIFFFACGAALFFTVSQAATGATAGQGANSLSQSGCILLAVSGNFPPLDCLIKCTVFVLV